MHDDEFAIDVAWARVGAVLVAGTCRTAVACAAHPGSSNALFRLGDDLLVRVPRQPGGSATIRTEARWLPTVAAALPVAVPEVVAVGEPGPG